MKTMKSMSNKTFAAAVGGSLAIIALLIVLCSNTPGGPGNTLMFRDSDEGVTLSSPSMVGGMGYGYDMVTGNSVKSESGMVAMDSYMPYPSPMPPSGGLTAAEAEQRIIKTADLAIAVDGVAAKAAEVTAIATGRGGFVQSSTLVEDEDGYKSGYVTVRVPSETFEAAVAAIKDLAVRVDRESINGQDVTEQYTDIEARLRSAKAQEEQYLEILQKAETVQDILSVQSYLQNIRYEIESLQGQLDSLGNQTEYSTISVSLSEEVRIDIPAEKFDLIRDIKTAGRYVVLLAQAALTYLIWFVIVGGAIIVPLALFCVLVVVVIKKIVSRF